MTTDDLKLVQEVLTEYEWSDVTRYGDLCPKCLYERSVLNYSDEDIGHSPDCKLPKALVVVQDALSVSVDNPSDTHVERGSQETGAASA